MRISLRQGFGAAPQVLEQSWADVLGLYGAAVQAHGTWASKEQVPLLAFGAYEIDDGARDLKTGALKGIGFREACLSPEGLWCIGLDYDDTPWEEGLRVIALAKELSPDGGLWHTTWQHGLTGNEVVRMRIVLPLGRGGVACAVPAEDWPTTWQVIANALAAPGLDQACKNVGRCWYLPSSGIPNQPPLWGAW